MSIVQFVNRDTSPLPLDPVITLLGDEPEGLALDFTTNRAWVRDRNTNSNNYLGRASDLVNFSRLSNASYFDTNGVLQNASNNQMRFDHDPVTGESLGIRLESASTNLIRNPRGEGAVAGTPGTPPTYWAIENHGGTSREIVGFGVEDGIDYIDVRFFGTVASATALVIGSEPQNYITAAVGETFTASAFVRLVGGSLAGVPAAAMWVWEALPNGNPNGQTGTAFTPTGAPLRTQRYSHTRTMGNVGTERVFQQVRLTPAIGATIDVTLRVGLPQMAKQAFVTSPIVPPIGSPQQTTLAAETLSLATTLFPYNEAAGTLIIDETQHAGVGSGTYINHYNELYRNNQNRIAHRVINSNVDNIVTVTDSTQVWASGYTGFPGGQTRRRVAFNYGSDGSAFVRNGTLLNAPTGAYTLPTALELLRLIQNGTSRTVRYILYIPRALSIPEMQARTTL